MFLLYLFSESNQEDFVSVDGFHPRNSFILSSLEKGKERS